MKIYLNVPYQEKDIAKARGCHWDENRKQWFIIDPTKIEMFVDWMPNHLMAPTKSVPLKHEPFVNNKISKDRLKRLIKKQNKKFRR